MIGSLAHRSTFCTPSPRSRSPRPGTKRSSILTRNRSRVRVALGRGRAQRPANLRGRQPSKSLPRTRAQASRCVRPASPVLAELIRTKKQNEKTKQATLYKMGQRLIKENTAMDRAMYTLPNKHYIPVDMKYIGIDNTSPFQSPASFLGKRQGANVMAQVSRGSVRAGFGSKVRILRETKEGDDENDDIIFSSGLINATVARVGASS